MKAIILAAGIGSRLRPLTSTKPKCMVTVAGRPIIDYQIKAYLSAGIKDIIIITGYESSKIKKYCRHIKDINLKIIENIDYETTNNMYSLYLAKEELDGEAFILSNGDVVFDSLIAYEVIHNPENDLIVTDLGTFTEESMKITVNSEGYINDISKAIKADKALGNSIDVYKFSQESSSVLFKKIHNIVEVENNLKDWTEVAIQKLLRDGDLKMKPFDISKKRWVEIDNYEDLAIGDKLFSGFENKIKSKKLFFIDLDGTIYLGDSLIDGAKEFIEKLASFDLKYYFLTNNSSKSKEDYEKRLNNVGINASVDNIIISTDGLITFLNKNKVKNVFVVGTDSMKKTLIDQGINTESEEPEYVVLGYDTQLNYEKIKKAVLYMQNGVELLATHCDMVCPTPEGEIPDIGAIMALLEASTGKKAMKIFGKPNKEMVQHVLDKYDIKGYETVFVGDRLYTDMKLAEKIEGDFVLVLSGETKRDMVEDSEFIPDLIVNNVGKIFGN
jgi:HAD superfamily hydrolase (TIGR01450 family)